MSRGFRNADATQDMSDKETADRIALILEEDREQASRAAALRAQGTYGICEQCGKEIGAERMEALPTATRCISCQAGWEQANRI